MNHLSESRPALPRGPVSGNAGGHAGYAAYAGYLRGVAVALVALVLASCAGARTGDSVRVDEFNDPYENFNRVMFDVNIKLDELIIRPTARAYRGVTPEPIRANVHNILKNLRLPLTALNSLLQGDFNQAGEVSFRFMSNAITLWMTDLGAGRPIHKEDAGQTLAVWTGQTGINDGGPYLVLPFFGPSNVRDGIGQVLDLFTDPVSFAINRSASIGRTGAVVVDQRAIDVDLVEELQRNSLDFYATVRSLYRQARIKQIKNEEIVEFAGLPTTAVGFELPENDIDPFEQDLLDILEEQEEDTDVHVKPDLEAVAPDE